MHASKYVYMGNKKLCAVNVAMLQKQCCLQKSAKLKLWRALQKSVKLRPWKKQTLNLIWAGLSCHVGSKLGGYDQDQEENTGKVSLAYVNLKNPSVALWGGDNGVPKLWIKAFQGYYLTGSHIETLSLEQPLLAYVAVGKHTSGGMHLSPTLQCETSRKHVYCT